MAFPIPTAITNNINTIADIEGYLSIAGTVTDIFSNFLPSGPTIQDRRMEEALREQERDTLPPSATDPKSIPQSRFGTERIRTLFDRDGGLAAANRFQVELPNIAGMIPASTGTVSRLLTPIGMENMSILCTTAQMPGKQVNVMSRQIGSDTRSVANGQTFTAVNLTFYLTNSYSIRKYFQYWMDCVMSQNTNEPMVAGFYNNYVRPIKIKQMDRNDKLIFTTELIEAFPTQMELIQLNNQAQTTAVEMTVSLAYRTYTTI